MLTRVKFIQWSQKTVVDSTKTNKPDGGIFKSCPRVPKLQIWLLRGWGRCLKVTLQTRAPENFRSCWWGDERTVQRAQTVSEDPHRRERNFLYLWLKQQSQKCSCKKDGPNRHDKRNQNYRRILLPLSLSKVQHESIRHHKHEEENT